MFSHLKTVLFFIVLIIFNVSSVFALNNEESVKDFMLQMESLMNRKNMYEIKNFYNYYASENATFIKHSQLIDPSSNMPSTQELKMDRAQYIDYLKAIISTPTKYSYDSNITQITMSGDIVNVSIDAKDTSLLNGFDVKTNKNYDIYVYTVANCNYSLEYKNTKYFIKGMNCSEKITKANVYYNESEIQAN